MRFTGRRRIGDHEGFTLLASFTRRTDEVPKRVVPVLGQISRIFRKSTKLGKDRSLMVLERPASVQREPGRL